MTDHRSDPRDTPRRGFIKQAVVASATLGAGAGALLAALIRNRGGSERRCSACSTSAR